MSLVLFNTLSRRKEVFAPITPGEVRMYTCGPTVYDSPHIGNLRTFLFEDVLRRWLKMSGYRVIQVMNLTDVDDKTILGACKHEMKLRNYTEQFVQCFFEDLKSLQVEPAEHYPRATDHIDEMVVIIQELLSKGVAYRGDDGSIYYNISKFPNYGKLAHFKLDELKVGARVSHDEYDKEQASDFALWKAWDADDGEVFWETALGKGRPGWHIECTAMSMKYLGPQLDIHTGGVDNIFPHHQNEIAQSEAYTGKTFVNYWLHAEHLMVDGKKMSKSLGNFYTLKDVVAKGFLPMALRYLFVTSHYRSKLNLTESTLQASEATLERIREFLRRLNRAEGTPSKELADLLETTRQKFEESMNDDLNTPRAAGVLHELITKANVAIEQGNVSNEQAKQMTDFFLYTDQLFGLDLKHETSSKTLPDEISRLIAEREAARKNKDFQKGDELRKILQQKGYVVEDTPAGPQWKALLP